MKKLITFILLLISLTQAHTQIVKFAAIGDYGGFTENGGAGELAVANMVKSWDTDTSFFIITLGDNNYYPTVEADQTIDRNIGQFYHKYIYPYNQAGFSPGYSPNPQTVNRFFPAMGNHDHYGNPVYSYYLYFTFTNINRGNSASYPGGIRYYDFQKGNVHFFCLNSGVEPSDHTGYNFYSEPDGIDSNSVQGRWLKTRLSQSTAKWKIVYFHHPPYFSIYGFPTDSYKALRYPFKRWGASVVLCGHLHTYEKLYIDGMTYITNGLGGDSDGLDSLYQPAIPGSLVRYSANYGALKCEAYTDSLVLRFINIDNQLVDYSRITENGLGPPPTKFYVNDNSLSGNIYTTAPGNDFNSGSSGSPFATIAHAILVAEEGDTIVVDAGNYTENISINKSLVISGTNKNNNGFGGRIAESIIQTSGNQNSVINVTAGNVIIEGLTVNGDDPLVSGTNNAKGNDVNANTGILLNGVFNGVKVRNNILKNLFSGIKGEGYSIENKIEGNWFDGIGNFNKGSAISLQSNRYADITNNKMSGVWTGIAVNDFNSPCGNTNWNITGNEIYFYSAGFYFRNQKQNAAPLNFNNNRIIAETGAVADNIGLLIISVKDSVYTNFLNSRITGADYGIALFDNSTVRKINLTGSDTVADSRKAGIFFTDLLNFNPVDTVNFSSEGHGESSELIFNGIFISSAAGIGIEADASGGSNSVLNFNSPTVISGGYTGLILKGNSTYIAGNSFNNLSFTGQSGKYIELINNALSGLTINASGALFDGSPASDKNISQNFFTEDKITHRTDQDSLGFIMVKTGNVFITPDSYKIPWTSSPSIMRGINAASTGFTVNIANGIYNEDIEINKSISLKGESAEVIIKGLYGAHENTIKINSGNSSVNNITVTRDYGNDLTSWQSSIKINGIYLSPGTRGIKIETVVIKGNRNGITTDNSQNSEIINCRIDSNYNGIILKNNTDSTTIRNCFIQDNFASGIIFDFDAGSLSCLNSVLNSNNISNNWYSQINFKRDSVSEINPESLNGLSMSCNWYGSIIPSVNISSPEEPAYSNQIPAQFGGIDPGLNRSLYGIESPRIPYIPWLINNTDTDIISPGFQPEDSCTGNIPVTPMHKFYVNDSSMTGDVFTSAAGNNSNNGSPEFPFATIGYAVSSAADGDSIFIDAGTYFEDIKLDKKLYVSGVSGSTILKGLYNGDSSVVEISFDSTVIRDLTVTRDYGNDLVSWQTNTKYSGIKLKQGTDRICLIGLSVSGNRQGIYVNDSRNLLLTNCSIVNNYSGIRLNGNISGAEIHNNFVRGNFTNGLLFDFDLSPEMVLTDVHITENNISDNWYSQVNFRHENSGIYMVDTSGFKFNCNWYGNILTSSKRISEYLPDYTELIPLQFEGTDPHLDRQLYGKEIFLCPYKQWLTNGFDNDTLQSGFQETPGSCNGYQHAFYVNDSSSAGDVYTSDTGSNLNSGTPAAPFRTVSYALSSAMKGDTVYVDAGAYQESTVIDKSVIILGANALISPNYEIRRAETELTGVYSFIISCSDKIEIKGFRFVNIPNRPLISDSSGSNLFLEKNILESCSGIYFSEPDTLKIKDNKFKDIDSVFESGIEVNGNYNGISGTYVDITNNIWKNCKSGGLHLKNVKGLISANDFNSIQNFGLKLDSTAKLSISKNIFSGIISNFTNYWNSGAGIIISSITGGSDLFINENYFTQNKIGIAVSNNGNQLDSEISVNNNSFIGNSGENIKNMASGTITAACNWYGTADASVIATKLSNSVNFFPYLTTGTDIDEIMPGFQPESDACNGHFTSLFVNDNSIDIRVYTSSEGNDANPGTSSAPLSTIRKAILMAQPNDTIFVDAGTYYNNDTINKPLTIIGAGNNLTVIHPLFSNPNPAGAGTDALFPVASNVFLVSSDDVVIKKISIDGDNALIESGLLINGADIDARNGIVTNFNSNGINGLMIDSVIVKNIYQNGIAVLSGGSNIIKNISADNILGNELSSALSNYGGNGIYLNNLISRSSQAIVSKHSSHFICIGNNITHSGVGIYTEYSGEGSSNTDSIAGNSISDSRDSGKGIFIYSPFRSAVVKENVITKVDEGFINSGQSDSAVILFNRNIIDGQNKSGSRGILQTTVREGSEGSDVRGNYFNNFVVNNSTGFFLESETGFENKITANENLITGNAEAVKIINDSFIINNFSCNWWGASADYSDFINSSLNFTPYLMDGTDNDTDTLGFQPVPGSCSGNLKSEMIVKLIPEGLFSPDTKRLTLSDTVKAYIHNNSTPYSIIDSAVSVLDTVTYTADFVLSKALEGIYYIEISHRNSVSTWSKAGGENFILNTDMHYDFTLTPESAFGNNLIQFQTEPILFGIFSGDVSRDGIVDLSDLILIHNDVSNFISGYVISDINGDDITDLNDIIITYNNSVNFVEKKIP